MRKTLRLQTRLTLFVCIVVLISLLITLVFISIDTERNIHDQEKMVAVHTAKMVAESNMVKEAFETKDFDELEDYTNHIQKITETKFIVVMNMNGIRLTHPDPSKIGKRFSGGDEKPVLSGKEHISTASGTLGDSLRAFIPIYNNEGDQVGAVAVGITMDEINDIITAHLLPLYFAIFISLGVGVIGAVFVARKVKNLMFGMEPDEIATILKQRSAMLESTKEGILAIDKTGKITLVNAEAKRLFSKMGISKNPLNQELKKLLPNSKLLQVIESKKPQNDRIIRMNGLELVFNEVPIQLKGEIVGAIATFRDKTEVKHLMEQLTGIKMYANALRAQSHEFMNKLHVILGLVRLKDYDELGEYIKDIAINQQTVTTEVINRIKNPVLAGFLLGKQSYIREQGASLQIVCESVIPNTSVSSVIHDLITAIGNLLNNALDAVSASEIKEISLSLKYKNDQLFIEVIDSGTGISKEEQAKLFEQGYSTKGKNRGYGLYLVEQSVERLNGHIVLISEKGEGSAFSIRIPYIQKEEKND